MDEIEEVVLTLTPYEASVLKHLLEYVSMFALGPVPSAPNKRVPADQVVFDIDTALCDVGVTAATNHECLNGIASK